jgi:cytochrome c-type biogenesis protein CcsB
MNAVESVLIWSAVYLYTITSILLLIAFVFNKDQLIRPVPYLMIPAFITHSVVFFSRWYTSGYFPANGRFETTVTGGWFAILLTLLLFFKRKNLRGTALFTVPATLILLAYGIFSTPQTQAVSVSLKSSWLLIHVLFAQLAFGSYLVASGLGLVYLLKDNRVRRGGETPFYSRFPDLPLIDEIMFKFAVFGFLNDAIMIAAGSIWAKDLWGSYWSWDPVEVWSLISWLIYALTIHLRVTLGWRGRRLAWILLFAVLGIIITYWGVDAIVENSMHVFGVSNAK